MINYKSKAFFVFFIKKLGSDERSYFLLPVNPAYVEPGDFFYVFTFNDTFFYVMNKPYIKKTFADTTGKTFFKISKDGGVNAFFQFEKNRKEPTAVLVT